MTYGYKTGGKNFIKGQSGNPNGRPRLPEEVKELRKINNIELSRLFNKYFFKSVNELLKIFSNKNLPVADMSVIKICLYCANKGDHIRLGFILDRLIGRPVQQIKHTGDIDEPIGISISDKRETIKKLLKNKLTRDAIITIIKHGNSE